VELAGASIVADVRIGERQRRERMRISFNPLHQNWRSERSGRQFIQEEMELTVLCEELGFDIVLPPEHHFDEDYSASPDNFMTLTHVAAKTSTMQVGLGAIILPWNDPLRIVEKISLLDHLSNGRLMIGFGRGLSKMEYEMMGIPMEESRERMDEAFEMVMRGLKTGIVEGDGRFYKQPKATIVPKPRPELADHFLAVGMSPDSAVRAGEMGGELLMFITGAIEDAMPLLTSYRDKFAETQGRPAPPPTMTDFVFVHEDPAEARKGGELYAGRYYEAVVRHYSFSGEHFAETKGYETYAAGAAALRDAGMDAATQAYVDAQAGIGTPEQVLEKYRKRMEVSGPFNAAGAFFYGGMTKDEGERNTRLFAEAVMPGLREMYDEFVAKEKDKARAVAS
jgi:alkanesulfonate monooxygenase SsuD/methylene tetrahydromethanopterin reductase-like flavin-dependent oxidoreductase (luciferase family)